MKIVYPKNCLWPCEKRKAITSLIKQRIVLLLGESKAKRIDELIFEDLKRENLQDPFELSLQKACHYKIKLDEKYLFNLIKLGDGRNQFDAIILKVEKLSSSGDSACR